MVRKFTITILLRPRIFGNTGSWGMVINEAIIENVVRQHFNSYPEDVPVEEEKSGIPQIE